VPSDLEPLRRVFDEMKVTKAKASPTLSRQETSETNPKSEYRKRPRGPKQTPRQNKTQIGKIQNTEYEGSLFGILPILVI
jgi:hypothetical protein